MVHDRLAADGERVIEATWANGHGLLTVSTPHGTVLARLESVDGDAPVPRAPVLDACAALRDGDASALARLFEPAQETAALAA